MKVLTVTIGIFLVGDGNAQEALNLQLEPLYIGVAGANTHFANITTTSGNGSVSNTTSQNFGVGGNMTFRGQLEYMPGDWGVGISGWWFDTSGSINQSINQNLYYASKVSLSYSSNNFTGSSPYGYSGLLKSSANNSLGVWNLDAYVIKSLGEFQNGGINLTFGAKFGGLSSINLRYLRRRQMFPWLWLYAPQLYFPWSGSVAQQIEPNVDWFFDSINAAAGDGKIERKAFDKASYGTQLGLLL